MSRYELLERIGIGGMAEIFRGRAIGEGGFEKPVAIKKILPHLGQDERFIQMLMQEASILANLRQRNIVQIYDVGIGDDGQYFLVMEFVDGGDLGALYDIMEKDRVRFPVDIALHIGSEVCEALDHAHKATDPQGVPLGIIHRDVSPSNVLLSLSGEVKLTDFGIAKRQQDASAVTSIKGKFAYMSPEQASAAPLTNQSDIYSLGIVLYELVVGRRLYSSMNDFDALRLVRKGKYPRPRSVDPSLSRDLEDIIVKALSADPSVRYATAGQLGAALRDHRYSISTSAGDPSTEVANLVARYFSKERKAEREATVVRITTAAGFDPDGSTGGGRVVDQLFDASEGTDGRDPALWGPPAVNDDDATRLHRTAPRSGSQDPTRMAPMPPPRATTPTLRNLGPQLLYQDMEESYQSAQYTPVPELASAPHRRRGWWLTVLFLLALVLGGLAAAQQFLPIRNPPRGRGAATPVTGTGDSLPAPTMAPAVKRD